MRIVVCVKEVLDPDAVNNYVLSGNLKIGEDGKTLDVSAVPRLMNGYDEQALEAAQRIRDAGRDCSITAVTIGKDAKALLKHCAAMGADDIVHIDAGDTSLDCHVVANILSAYIRTSGGADLVLCGRQASDDDQGVVPALIGETLDMPVVPLARAIEVDGNTVKVTRVTPDGDEVVEGNTPAVITISNELGEPRFPTARAKMAARKKKPTVIAADDLGLSTDDLTAKVVLSKQFVPQVQGSCEFLEGSPAEVAQALMEKLRADSLV
jgi:electron transfer flavoprotein beta subunit